MKCNTCGRQTQNEEANFCEYCGSSFREHMHTSINPIIENQRYTEPNQMPGTMAMQYPNTNPMFISPEAIPDGKPVSFLNWIGTYGILLIPLVGWLVFIIMLFIWSFGGTVPKSKKNWARATLIFTAIMLIIIIIYMTMLFSSPMYQQMMNGTFDYNSFYENIYNNAY